MLRRMVIVNSMMKGIDDCHICKSAVLAGNDSQFGALTLCTEFVQGASHLLYPTNGAIEVLQKFNEYFKSISASNSLPVLKLSVKSIVIFVLSKCAGNLPNCVQRNNKGGITPG